MTYFFAIYGPSKQGRSSFAATAPGRHLVVDYGGNWDFVATDIPRHDKGPIEKIGDKGLVLTPDSPARAEAAIDWALANTDKLDWFTLDNMSLLQLTMLDAISTDPTPDDHKTLSPKISNILSRLKKLSGSVNVTLIMDEIIFPEDPNLPRLSGRNRQLVLGMANLLGYLKETSNGRTLLIRNSESAVVGTNLTPLVEKYNLAIPNPDLAKIIKEIQ